MATPLLTQASPRALTIGRAGAIYTAYVIAYVLLDWLTFVQPVLKLGITPWSPQAGLTLAFLLTFGPRAAVLTAVAALLAEVLVRGVPALMPALVLASLLVAAGYGVAAHLLLRRGVSGPIENLRQAVWLITLSLAIALLVAAGYVAIFHAFDRLPAHEVVNSIARYWVADVNGILTVTPLVLVASRWRAAVRQLATRRWEVAAQILTVLGALWLIFGLRATDDLRFFYSLFVPVVWIAFRWGVAGTALCTFAIQVALVVAAQGEAEYRPLVDLQFLMITLGMTGILLGCVVMERLASEARLRERDIALARAMRFAAVGELASALTHELNQPITALVSYLRASQILAAPLQDQDARLPNTLDKAAREAMRTSDVLRKLRDFYRGGEPHISQVDFKALAASVVRSHEERLRAAGIRLRTDFDDGLPILSCDRTQVEMVMHNLLGNAVDALVGNPPETREILLSASRSDSDILIAIEDSGPGVPREIAGRLFSPFVTTKPDGVGLGLAISRSLLRSQGGELWAEGSSLGGARFVMRVAISSSFQVTV
jgi:signal transduction histidine kinase